MSLIEDALRRAQGATTQAKPAPGPSAQQEAPAPAHPWPTGTPGSPSPLEPSKNPQGLSGIAMAVLVLGVVLAIGGTRWFKQAVPIQGTAAPAQPAARSAPPEAEPAPKPEPTAPARAPWSAALTSQPSQTDPVLSGVVEGLGEPYAMIDGAIVSVGESIGGWTLVRVEGGTVTLRRVDGRDLTLSVPR